jgi:hypothetical protein
MTFMAATALAVDVGMFMTARSQAQNAADAGALAGAIALGFNSFDDRSPTGPAVQAAISTATSNKVMNKAVSVTSGDVTFPVGPSGQSNRVKATVYRTGARLNAVPTFMGSIFGVDVVDIIATATAEAAPANAMTCVKPFIIPDRWRDAQTGSLATQADQFDMYDKKGNLLPNPDTYIPSGPSYTGYNNVADRGTLLTLRAGSGNNVQPTFYYSLALGGITGGAEYDWNIANCNKTIMHRGDIAIQEPGNMVGPTVQGVAGLLARDPNATWDVSKKTVVNSAYEGQSPRVFPIPLYDPIYYADGKKNGRFADFKVANWIGFFLEQIVGNEIYGRIIPIAGIADSNSTSDNAFPIAIRLVQ